MFCDLGGVLGLYVGFSILTIFEFFELFASLVWICIVRAIRGPTPASPSVGRVANSAVSGDHKMQQSAHPPAYDHVNDHLTSPADQFQLFNATNGLPKVNC